MIETVTTQMILQSETTNSYILKGCFLALTVFRLIVWQSQRLACSQFSFCCLCLIDRSEAFTCTQSVLMLPWPEKPCEQEPEPKTSAMLCRCQHVGIKARVGASVLSKMKRIAYCKFVSCLFLIEGEIMSIRLREKAFSSGGTGCVWKVEVVGNVERAA